MQSKYRWFYIYTKQCLTLNKLTGNVENASRRCVVDYILRSKEFQISID